MRMRFVMTTGLFLAVMGWSSVVLGLDARARADGEAVPTVIGEIAGWGMFTHSGKADFKDPDNPSDKPSASATEVSVLLPFPVYQTENWQYFAGPQLDWYRYEFDHVRDLDEVDVYDVALQLGAAYSGIQNWEFMVFGAPGLYTDFRKIGREDFKFFSSAAAYWQCTKTIQLVGGAAYDTALGDDEIYPMGGVRWDPSPNLSLQLIFPEPIVLWAPTKGLLLFAHLLPAGGKWNTYDKTQDHERHSFKTEGWRTGCGIEVQLTELLWFHIAGGMEFDRNYEIENEDDDSMMKSDVDDTWYARVGVVLR